MSEKPWSPATRPCIHRRTPAPPEPVDGCRLARIEREPRAPQHLGEVGSLATRIRVEEALLVGVRWRLCVRSDQKSDGFV
jgi:hypothetical protein